MKIIRFPMENQLVYHVAFLDEANMIKQVYNFVTDRAYTVQPGEQLPEGCFVKIPMDMFDDITKAFAELAAEKGLKLDGDLKREGLLEATNRHLEDMRTLVFKKK